MGRPNVLVISSSGSPISVTKGLRALYLIDKGLAFALTDKKIGTIKSQDKVFEIPEVIQIKDCNYVKPVTIPWTKKGVLKRDNYTCVYCGETAKNNLSVDHIIPRSRFCAVSKLRSLKFNLDSWENTVTACKRCNQSKSSKLPEEMGIVVKPKPPLSDFEIQWAIIQDRELNSDNTITNMEGTLNGS